jgi:hypothetical protein
MRRLLIGIVLVPLVGGCFAAVSVPEACVLAEQGEGTDCELMRLSGLCVEATLAQAPSLYDDLAAVTLEVVPPELQYVLDHRARFTIEDHPLADVPLGTAIGSSSELAGCWARVQSDVLPDGSGGWVEAEFCRIDLDEGIIRSGRMTGVDGQACLEDARPFIQIYDDQVREVQDDRMLLEGIGCSQTRTTAGVNSDGSLSAHVVARFGWELSIGLQIERLFTVDGSFLATSKNRGTDPGARDLWLRLDCTEVGL